MAELSILYWRDIPAQVVAKAGRRSAKIVLTQRFEQAIDAAAMRAGAASSDDYLADWRRGAAEPCSDDLEVEARRRADALEAAYDAARLRQLIAAEGRAPD